MVDLGQNAGKMIKGAVCTGVECVKLGAYTQGLGFIPATALLQNGQTIPNVGLPHLPGTGNGKARM